MDKNCPCGNGKQYAECCQKLHNNTNSAETAEELMRSRYSAFCTGNVDYLIATIHPSQRKIDDIDDLLNSINNYTWINLAIISASKGKKSDHKGQVEFIAYYSNGEKTFKLHENSSFIKENGIWFYLDGKISKTKPISKNDQCWCHSGKKFKRCHGAN